MPFLHSIGAQGGDNALGPGLDSHLGISLVAESVLRATSDSDIVNKPGEGGVVHLYCPQVLSLIACCLSSMPYAH